MTFSGFPEEDKNSRRWVQPPNSDLKKFKKPGFFDVEPFINHGMHGIGLRRVASSPRNGSHVSLPDEKSVNGVR